MTVLLLRSVTPAATVDAAEATDTAARPAAHSAAAQHAPQAHRAPAGEQPHPSEPDVLLCGPLGAATLPEADASSVHEPPQLAGTTAARADSSEAQQAAGCAAAVGLDLAPPEVAAARICRLLRVGSSAGAKHQGKGFRAGAFDAAAAGAEVAFGVPDLDMLVVHLKAADLCRTADSNKAHGQADSAADLCLRGCLAWVDSLLKHLAAAAGSGYSDSVLLHVVTSFAAGSHSKHVLQPGSTGEGAASEPLGSSGACLLACLPAQHRSAQHGWTARCSCACHANDLTSGLCNPVVLKLLLMAACVARWQVDRQWLCPEM